MAYWRHPQFPVEYNAWNAMKVRCRNPRHPCYNRYGGRGITVDPAWDSFEQFIADMGPRPSPKHSLERENNEKGYSAANFFWATKQEQSRNRSCTRRLTAFGETKTLEEWAGQSGIRYATIWQRLQAGYSPEEAVSLPVNKKPRGNKVA